MSTMDQNNIILHIPALRAELKHINQGYKHIKENMDYLKEFAKQQDINSVEAMNTFLATANSKIKANLVNASKNITSYVDLQPKPLDAFLYHPYYSETKEDIDFIKKCISEGYTIRRETKVLVDMMKIEEDRYIIGSEDKTEEIKAAIKNIATVTYLVPSTLLAKTIIEIKNQKFDSRHDYSGDFLLAVSSLNMDALELQKSVTQEWQPLKKYILSDIKKYILEHINNNQDFLS
jgi:hypothetical protein